MEVCKFESSAFNKRAPLPKTYEMSGNQMGKRNCPSSFTDVKSSDKIKKKKWTMRIQITGRAP